MIDALKKSLLVGVGATLVTAEKVESVLKDLVEKGKLNAEDAKAAAARVANESRQEYEQARSSLQEMFDQLLAKAALVRKAELEALEKRVAELENRVKG